MTISAQEQCQNEFRSLLHRWLEESDLSHYELLEACNSAVVHYLDEPVVEFTPDDGLLDET
jgi:hypothetical protein